MIYNLPQFPEYEDLPKAVRLIYDVLKEACDSYREDRSHTDCRHNCTIAVTDPGVLYNETEDQTISLFSSVPCFSLDIERVDELLEQIDNLVASHCRLTHGNLHGPSTDGIRREIQIIYRVAEPDPEPEPEPVFDFDFEVM